MPGLPKRPVEVIDLTHNDPHRPSKIGRIERVNNDIPLANVRNGDRFGESADFIPLSQLDDDETGVNDIVQASQAFDDPESSSFQLYGCLNTKIVGVRYYSGYASMGERVSLQREPTNKFDPNAIRVLNVMGAQIGHLPRNVAYKLAKYMVRMVYNRF